MLLGGFISKIRSSFFKGIISARHFSCLCVVLYFQFLFFVSDAFPLTIGIDTDSQIQPHFCGTFDNGGFSDWIWYGPSPEHPVSGNHEVLSGEWGAGIYY
jgi:hypothetical protein